MKYDIVAIGDVVTDAFIRLLDDRAHVSSGHNPQLCMGYGDKIPFERSYVIPGVGNSANAAVSCARLGLHTALVTNIGGDRAGQEMIEKLASEGVGTEFIYVNKGMQSNYHYVLWYKSDRTILIKHEDFNYHLPSIDEPRWIYFSSVGEHALPFHSKVSEYLKAHPSVKLAFQPGTFQIKLGIKRLAHVYGLSEIIMCNRDEAQIILGVENDDIRYLAYGFHDVGARIAVITDGVKGAYISEGGTVWFMPNYPDPAPPFERTGAGDAFESTFIAALALGLSLNDAMRWAPINSMSVVQYVGAQEGLLRRSQLENYLNLAPANYKPSVFAKIKLP